MKRICTLISLLTAMVTISVADDWIDLTSEYITNPDFDGSSNAGWTMSASAGSTNCSYEAQEFWNGTWNFYQTVSLANGHYRLSVNGYHRPGDFSNMVAGSYESVAITSLLYANDTSTPLKSVYSESLSSNYRNGCWGYNSNGTTKWYPNNMEAGAYCFSQGMYKNELEFDVTDGSLIFGIINDTYVTGNWTMFDNWKLEYYGTMTYVSSITLDQEEKSLVVGEKFQLVAKVLPADATLPSLEWTSSNTNIATVDTEGTVTGISLGTATITAAATDGSGTKATCTITVSDGSANLSDIIITEIQSANIDQFIDPSWNYGGWVELYNPGDTGVPIQGCWVSDDPSNLQMVHISQPMAVPAKGYLNLWFDHHDKYCPSQMDMQLDEEGGTIYISDTNGKLITSQTYPEAVSRCSYARKSLTGNEWAWTSTPTPEQANDGSTYCTERLEAPTVDKDSQIFGTTLTVCVNIPEGTTLKYTIDGSAPTATNGETSATGLFYPSATTCYRFCLIQDGYLPSPVITRTYIYQDKEFALPVFSVTSADDNFYSDDYGIFVQGNGNGRAGNGQSSACNWNMDWDRPANFEYINTEGEMVVNKETAIERCGGWSRAWEPYSFKVKANKQYELQNYLPYDFFSEKPYLKHKSLQMRNGGNDTYCRIEDAALQEIVMRSGIDVDCQGYQPVMHYINGKYAGVINMREPNNKHYVYSNYGLDDDEIDQFEMSPDSGYIQKCGTYESMQRWYDLAAECSDDAVYEEIKQMVDIDEYCNYMAVCFYLGNTDWPQNNVKGWKPIMDGGKYRFILFDLDQAFATTSTFTTFANKKNYTFDLLYGESVSHITKEIEMVTIFINMLNNENFRKQFIDTYCLVAGSVFEASRCKDIIYELCDNVSSSQSIYSELYRTSSTPWSTAYNIVNSLSTSRQSAMINTLKNYSPMGLSKATAQSVTLSANIDEARLLVNGLPVPTNTFSGKLFAPVTLKAGAPAGYSFVGWRLVSGTVGASEVISKGSTWRYYDGGSLDSEDWTATSYTYSGWGSGAAPLGYCAGDTLTTNLTKSQPTYYFANSFNLDSTPGSDDTFTLNYTVDDGFIIYVNGTEAGRYNMPSGTVLYDDLATTFADGNPDSGTMTLETSLFRKGANYITVEVHNNDLTSSDIYWDASLSFNSSEATGEIVCTDEEYEMPTSGTLVLQACYDEMSDEEKLAEGLSATPIVINEVSAGNSINVNEYFKKDDWVELYNTTSDDIDLEGMFMTDNSAKPHKYQITAAGTKANAIIPAHGYKIIWCSNRETDTELHANFKLGNNDGEMVRVCASDDSWADSLVYCAMNGDQSVGRYPDGGENVYLMTKPTIKSSNLMNTYATLWSGEEGSTDIEDIYTTTTRNGGMSIACVGDFLSVKSEESDHVTLGVHTLSGITVMFRDVSMEGGHGKVNISTLPAGVYVARATDGEGGECATKFVKK